MHLKKILLWCLTVLMMGAGLFSITPVNAMDCRFLNPLLPQGQDPSVVFHEGFYYLVQSGAQGLTVAKSATITGLGQARPVPVFAPPPGMPYSFDLWAPEIAYLRGKWYIYVAGTSSAGANPTHRMFALEADTDDPQGTWTMRGKVYDPEADFWAIDGVVFEHRDKLYMVWSGWETTQGDFPQNLYIASMSDPWTLDSPRVLLSEPDQPWEQTVAAIQEGPQPFIHNGILSIVYSGDASWTHAYKLAAVTLSADGDPLNPADWTKSEPLMSEGNGVFGPGHNSSPVPSPDGTEDWLIYHAKSIEGNGWQDRYIRAQRFSWSEDNIPVFGEPVGVDQPVPVPSGEPCGEITPASDEAAALLAEEHTFAGDFLDTDVSYINTLSSFSVEAWVNPDRAEAGETFGFVSQDGGINSHFALQLIDGHYAFTLFAPLRPGSASATAEASAVAGEWVHLVGVRDFATNEHHLYVNGALAATATYDEQWSAQAHLIIGAARHEAERADQLFGRVRGVRLYNGAMSADEVAAAYAETQE